MSEVVATPEEQLREVEASLARRIQIIELENLGLRQYNRRFLIGLAATVGLSLLTLVVVAVQGRPGRIAESIQAQRIALVDSEGAVRGEWFSDADGAPQIVLRDQEGRPRLRLSVLADGSTGVSLVGRDNRPRAVLGVLPDQTTNLVLADSRGRTRAIMGTASDAATLLFADQEGTPRAVLGTGATGSADLTLFQEDVAPAASDAVDTAAAAAGIPPTQ